MKKSGNSPLRGLVAALTMLMPTGFAVAQETPQPGGELVYYDYLATTSFQLQATLWYQNSGVSNQIVDRLVYRDPTTGEISPWLSTNWEVSDDQKVFTFKLRDGVTFSDGSALDAETVVVNLDVLAHGDREKGVPRNSLFPAYDRAEIVDPQTVRVHLSEPSGSFLDTLSDWRAGILSQATYALPLDEQSKIENLIGSGPFVFDSQVRGREIVLKRREDYAWAPEVASNQGPAYLETIRYVAVPEASVRIGALLSGQADAIRYVPPIDEPRVLSAGAQILSAPVPGIVQQLTIHPGYPNLGDVRVRQAVQAAVNRQEIVDTIFSESYPPARSVLDSLIPGFVDLSDLFQHDAEKASRLLDEAGWTRTGDGVRTKDGQELVLAIYVAPFYIQSKELQELLAAQFDNIGVRLEIKATDIGSYAAATETSETAFVQTNRARGSADILHQFYHSKVNNLLLESDPKLDSILEGFVYESGEKRDAGVAEAQRYLIENAYTIPLYEERQLFGLGSHVKGFSTETLGRPWFYQTWVSR